MRGSTSWQVRRRAPKQGDQDVRSIPAMQSARERGKGLNGGHHTMGVGVDHRLAPYDPKAWAGVKSFQLKDKQPTPPPHPPPASGSDSLGEHGRIPDGIVRIQPHKPAEQQDDPTLSSPPLLPTPRTRKRLPRSGFVQAEAA